jgi:hypothetical protein
MRSSVALFGVLSLLAGVADADVVVERWGAYRYVQHKTVRFDQADGGTKMVADLSALPKGAAVFRARLVFIGGEGYEVSYKAGGKDVPLELVPPYDLWFDATDAVRSQLRAGRAVELLIAQPSRIRPENTFLEVAYEGKLADPPEQATGLKITYHPGQCLITWREIWDIAGGKENITWGEMVKRIRTCTPLGIVPKDEGREIRYRIYRHTESITPAKLGKAELIHEVMPGSVYIDERVARGKVGEQGPTFLKKDQGLVRVTLAPGKTLPPGTGFRAHTVTRAGKAWYAVVTAVNGIENTTDLSDQNVVGPIEQTVTTPRPVLYAEKVSDVRRHKGAKYYQQWYSWWLTEPLSPYPKRYDVVLDYCPATMAKPAPLTITRGHAWITRPEPPRRPSPRKGIVLSPSSDSPNAFWMGIPDSFYSLKSREQGKWRPWPQRRAEFLIQWVKSRFPVDENRIVGSIGCWGMMEIERPDLYAYIHGWGLPEVTKGFQAYNRATLWGPPHIYADRPNEHNPWVRQDYSRYVLADPKKETPFFQMHMGWGAHFSEMGWPSLPRFYRAMMTARRPFVVHWKVRDGRPAIRRDRTVPAFGNCSLDDMPGNGDPHHGTAYGAQINGYLTWDADSTVDTRDHWEMTVRLDGSAPLDVCSVDLTPRRCQKFRAKPGDTFAWTNTVLPAESGKDAKAGPGKVVGSGTVKADRWGLVTVRELQVGKTGSRVHIERK